MMGNKKTAASGTVTIYAYGYYNTCTILLLLRTADSKSTVNVIIKNMLTCRYYIL